MKIAVITGATSMLGTATAEQLVKHGVKVYAVIRPSCGKTARLPDSPLLHVVQCALEEIETLPQKISEPCEVFYHFAWTGTGERNADITAQSRNISYTLLAMQAAKRLGCKTFIGAGSQAEYGRLDVDKISPDSPVWPVQPYGIAKYAAGRLCMEAASNLEIACVWVRIFSVYGTLDRATTMVSALISKLQKGEPCSFTKGTQRWDYLYETDAGRAFYLIGERCEKSKVYCLGSGSARPLREYAEAIRDCIAPTAELEFGSLPYTNYSVLNLCADISELTKDTGFTPEISFEEGIRRIIAYRAQQTK